MGIELMNNIYLPIINQKKTAASPYLGCVKNEQAAEMARIFAESDWQQRSNPTCHPLLAQAAQTKAEDMLRHRYFGHTMHDGSSANANVRATGYVLPDWYAADANSVESIILNIWPPEKMFEAWATSPTHWRHIAGLHPAFAGHGCFGMGYAEGPEDAGKYGVLITAPCPEVQ